MMMMTRTMKIMTKDDDYDDFSPMDLQRVAAEKAAAVLVLCNKFSSDPCMSCQLSSSSSSSLSSSSSSSSSSSPPPSSSSSSSPGGHSEGVRPCPTNRGGMVQQSLPRGEEKHQGGGGDHHHCQDSDQEN